MKKSDLRTGMRVVLRNGDERFAIAEFESFFLYEEESCELAPTFDSYDYDDVLRSLDDKSFDILEVWEGKKLLWQRMDIKLTEYEKVILRNLDDEYEYIARDSYGDYMSIFGSKPYFENDMWKVDGLGIQTDFPYAKIFKTITLENSPILISDLLEGE